MIKYYLRKKCQRGHYLENIYTTFSFTPEKFWKLLNQKSAEDVMRPILKTKLCSTDEHPGCEI
jgi:hypothetical protein